MRLIMAAGVLAGACCAVLSHDHAALRAGLDLLSTLIILTVLTVSLQMRLRCAARTDERSRRRSFTTI